MGLTIDKERATVRFGRALVLARSDEELPADWLDRTRKIGEAKNKTFTPMFGTALVARTADEEVDVRSLREDESDRGYSARSVAKEVLVPCCVRAGIDLRIRGLEPLNNQPFLRASRVSTALKVTKRAVPELEHLCECLDAVEILRGNAALDALAAFLRVRIAASAPPSPVAIGPSVLSLPELLQVVDAAASEDDTGAVGVAITTAALGLLFEDVRARRTNDPTSTWPGDIGVFDDRVQTLAVQARSRLTEADILVFAARMAESDVRRGIVVALAPEQDAPDSGQLQFQARRLHQVELSFFSSAGELLRTAAMLALRDLTLSLADFPRLVLHRMADLGIAVGQMEHWSAAFVGKPDGQDSEGDP